MNDRNQDRRQQQGRRQQNGGTMQQALGNVVGNVRHQLPGANFLMSTEERLREAIKKSQMESTEKEIGKILRFVLEHTEEDAGHIDFVAYLYGEEEHVWLECVEAAGRYGGFLRFTAKDRKADDNVIPTNCHMPFGWLKSYESPESEANLPDCGVGERVGVHWDIDRMMQMAEWLNNALTKHRALHEEALRRAAAVLTPEELAQKLAIKKPDQPKPVTAPAPQGNGRSGGERRRDDRRDRGPRTYLEDWRMVFYPGKLDLSKGPVCIICRTEDGAAVRFQVSKGQKGDPKVDFLGAEGAAAEVFAGVNVGTSCGFDTFMTERKRPTDAMDGESKGKIFARLLAGYLPRRERKQGGVKRPDADVVADQQEAGRAVAEAEGGEALPESPVTTEAVREDQLAAGALMGETEPSQAEPLTLLEVPPADDSPSGEESEAELEQAAV